MSWYDKEKTFDEISFGTPEEEVLERLGNPNKVSFKKDDVGNDVKVCLWTRTLSKDFLVVEFTDNMVSHGILSNRNGYTYLTRAISDYSQMEAMKLALQEKNNKDSAKAIRQKSTDYNFR